MTALAQTFALAVKHHQAGNLRQAEELYRQILRAEPRHADALHMLGVLAGQAGKHDLAGEHIRQALQLKPDFAGAHNSLGNILHEQGKLTEAVDSYLQALRLDPDNAGAHNNLAVVYWHQGKLDDAVAHIQRALRLQPNNAEVHSNLGNILRQQGKIQEAISSHTQALRLKPDYAEAHNNLGVALWDQGKLDEAVSHLQTALRLKPDHARAHFNLGNVLRDQGKATEAAAGYAQALRLRPDFAEAHNNLATVLQEQGKLDDAVAHIQQALRLKPDYAEAQNNLGDTFLIQGRLDEAVACFQESLRMSPSLEMAYHQLGRLTRDGKYRFTDAQIAHVRQRLADPACSLKDKTRLHFTLAYLAEKEGDYDLAFEHYRQGNACKRQASAPRQHFNIQDHRRYFDQLISAFGAPFFARAAALGHDSQTPVFIVGMPRSGTTLVEQILSSHPQFAGAGELKDIGHIPDELPGLLGGPEYPACVAKLNRETTLALAERYLKRLREQHPQALRVSDKMPQNFVNLGLIALMFPRARVIHCRRDPRDTCVSCFCENFAEISFPSSLEDLGRYYGDYERLMTHWRQVLPLAMFEVQYEELVADLEAVSRRLLSFCGLDWDDRCLRFHETARPVYTASRLQVRQPIYSSSVGRWRRYQSHLGPLLALLEPYLPAA